MTVAPHIPSQVPAGVTPQGDGIRVGHGSVVLDAYIDFLCPFCRMFEQTSGELLDALVNEEAITLVYHPLGFLDNLSTTRYSTRAAAASGCASDLGMFPQYADALYANQPPEGGPGLSDAELVALGEAIGIPRDEFAPCAVTHRYAEWVGYVTEVALARGVGGTPSVFVQGVPVPANPRTIAAAVQQLL
ncbi:MAG TPA: thioredoxin domain-containing protein [Jatrophihabitans sp.]|nr:thioredoxin domain-containing protein [Jatrophihabitans sp.]